MDITVLLVAVFLIALFLVPYFLISGKRGSKAPSDNKEQFSEAQKDENFAKKITIEPSPAKD